MRKEFICKFNIVLQNPSLGTILCVKTLNVLGINLHLYCDTTLDRKMVRSGGFGCMDIHYGFFSMSASALIYNCSQLCLLTEAPLKDKLSACCFM
jgi:hypothetical protein